MILCAYLDAGSTFEQKDGGVGDVESRECCTCKVVTARAIDKVDFLTVPLHVAYGGEY